MAFAESFHNQSSVLRINVMVVDDDPVFLKVISRMLEKSKYRDPSIMDIRVIAEGDPFKALSTLKHQRNNIDLIIIDYYMPGMNGLQLKRKISEEIGNLPFIVMSSDTNKEQESLTCGAMGFLAKPIKPIDLPKIYQIALTSKRNGKSWSEPNHKEACVNVPQQLKMLPEQANILKTKKKCTSKPDSRSLISTNGSGLSTDNSRKNRKRKPNGSPGEDGESSSQPPKKPKITWTDGLQDLFLQAIRHIGLDKAVPKKILAFMNVPDLTRENIASHLQKYRIFLKKVAKQGLMSIKPGRGMESMFRYTHIKDPYFNHSTTSTSWYDTSLNNRSFYSKSGHGFGQSRLLSDTRAPDSFNPMPHNYMNGSSSTYEPHRSESGSDFTLPIQSNISLLNQASQNEERRSFYEPHEMANKVSQTSQVHGFGQLGPSSTIGNNFNTNMMSSFGSFTPNQPGLSHVSYGMQSFLNNENTTYNLQPHANATTHQNLELDKTNELPYNFQLDQNKQQHIGEEASTKFDLSSNFSAELNQILSLEDDGDMTSVNVNQGETSNTFTALEIHPPSFTMNPNENQVEQDFIYSLFNTDMN
ncbi:hypothetical protein CARUB_v10006317mg [Capsella rubella]|uniref:Response regulatory domain-containing protein n=1 Tax=Capsella rubella TaxID=81985 RepID=R0H333_9BRAS|nr:hypothetical protein CARUB_v10006317mg [Capsella rubella]